MIDTSISYWHWVIYGLLMLAIEIVLPTFTLFWFGCAALLIGAILFFIPTLPLEVQFVVWAVVSAVFTFLWFKLLKPKFTDKTKAGLSRESVVGSVGFVINAPRDGEKGTVRFAVPVMGDEEWLFVSEESLENGDKVSVIDVSGNTFVVKKYGG
jgi:membrane protein implicated in regulation of membrane protease activity